jgi:hypothetical protein
MENKPLFFHMKQQIANIHSAYLIGCLFLSFVNGIETSINTLIC